MNWEVGILAFFLYFVPVIAILVIWYQRDKEIDHRYDQQMKEIRERYYGK